MKYFQKAGPSPSEQLSDPIGDVSDPDVSDCNEGEGDPDESGCDEGESSIQPPAKRHHVMNCRDVADYVGSTISVSDSDKYQLRVNHFKPTSDFKFPKSANGRSFQFRWLHLYPWLAYSKQKNGGFCIPCVLFATRASRHQSDPGVLVQRPLTQFSKALELLRKHSTKEHHKIAVVRSDEFLQVMNHQQPTIQHRINQAVADRVSSNRQILACIVKTIVICGRQNFAIRGHQLIWRETETTR